MTAFPTTNAIQSGPDLILVLTTALRANVPVKLNGGPGVGKTEAFGAAASEIDVGLISLNLAAMEPADLLGMPKLEGDHVRYLPPAWLQRVATDTRGGFLLLDEINRIGRYMVAPLHQIITERAINGVQFKPGWLPCAAANVGAMYNVEELDPALESRFLTINVLPSVASWARWAVAQQLDQRVVDFVSSTPDIFASSSPRDWTNVARLMREAETLTEHMLEAMVAGIVGPAFATAFVAFAGSAAQPLKPEAVIVGSAHVRDRLRNWRDQGNFALLAGSLHLLQAHLQSQAIYDRLSNAGRWNVLKFVWLLPAELRSRWNAWATKCGYHRLIFPKGRAS